MTYKLLNFLIILSFMSATCGSNKSVTETPENTEEIVQINQYTDNKTNFSDVVLESRTTFAGVESNLKGVRRYELKLKVDLSEAINFTRLMVDTVSMPFNSLIIGGERVSGLVLDQDSELVKLTTFRNIYSNSRNMVHEETKYDSSGLNLEEGAVIEYFMDSKPYYLEIEKITSLPAIYAP